MAQAIFISGPCGAGKSTVAADLAQRLNCPVVEVDDVKVERHGTTAISKPDDFSEAGRRAKQALVKHERVIVVEAFGDNAWIQLVSRELPTGTPVSQFYLWCDPEQAVQRKAGKIGPAMVRYQFQRFNGPTHPGRISFDTTSRSPSEIAREIVANLPE